MYALVVEVEVEAPDRDEALRNLREQVVPAVQAVPGFRSGTWLAPDENRKGMAVILFEDERSAHGAAERTPAGSHPQPGVTVERSVVREVGATA